MNEKEKKRVSLVVSLLAGIVILAAAAIYILMFHDINAIASIKQVRSFDVAGENGAVVKNLYTMKYNGDYYLSDFQASGGVSSDADLIGFVASHVFRGVAKNSVKAQIPKIPDPACTTFSAALEDGSHIFARNFDNKEGHFLILTTNPTGRYKSVATVNLGYLKFYDKALESLMDKFTLLASPYASLDGMNEKGVAIAVNVLSVDSNRVNDESADPDTNITGIIRLVLDYAASVDEAAAIFNRWDLHDSIGSSYHFQIADRSGDSAVIEFLPDSDGDGKAERRVIRARDSQLQGVGNSDAFLINTNHSLIPGARPLSDGIMADLSGPQGVPNGIDDDGYLTPVPNPDSSVITTFTRWQRAYDGLKPTNGLLKDEKAAMAILEQAQYERSTDLSKTQTFWSVVYNLDDLSATIVGYGQYDKPYTYKIQ